MKAAVVRGKQDEQQRTKPLVGPCDDLQELIVKRAVERYQARGCQDGFDLEDRLAAEREVLSQVPPV